MSDVEVIGLVELLVDLERAERVTPEQVHSVVTKGALNVKKGWQRRWSGLSHLPGLAGAVTYDTKQSLGEASAEIGPDKNRFQGPLGNIAEYGTENNAPHPGGLPSLAEEEPRFERALADLGAKLLSGGR